MCGCGWERSAAEGKGAGAAGQRTSNINVCYHLLAALRHFSSTTEDKMSCGRGYANIFLRVPAVHFTGKPRYSCLETVYKTSSATHLHSVRICLMRRLSVCVVMISICFHWTSRSRLTFGRERSKTEEKPQVPASL